MKIKLALFVIFSCITMTSCNREEKKAIKPLNYVVIIDLSDRILVKNQLDKDILLIASLYKKFEEKSKQNLILNAKNRFSVKIIPQKNSPLDTDYFENKLQIYLDEINVKDKHSKLQLLSNSLSNELRKLKREALYSQKSNDYFGVDIWAYFHDNGKQLSKPNYENKVLVLTDGYFDFENQSHVIRQNSQYTSTSFLKELTTSDWKQKAISKKIGLLPIQLDKNTKWIIAGVSGKKANDILQTEKIIFFWKKWLLDSGVDSTGFILNGSKNEMGSLVMEQFKS
jgi:hypothetical protein